MPMKTDLYWVERIKSLKAQNPRWGAGRITGTLEQEAQELGRTDAPSERTVARIIDREWEPLSETERGQYRLVYWPETFERGDLPWEAAKAVSDLLGLTFAFDEERPSVQLAKWYWRLNEISGDLPPYDCEQLARLVSTLVRLGKGEEVRRHVERFLACTPWTTPQERQDYLESLRRDPIPSTALVRSALGAELTLKYANLEPHEEEDIQFLMDSSGRRRSELKREGFVQILIEGMEIIEPSLEEEHHEAES